jgi:hypothetical protein
MVDTRPLRHHDFRLLFAGQTVTYVGSWVTYVAIPFQVFQLTRSPVAVGLLSLAELAPLLATARSAGRWRTRWTAARWSAPPRPACC